MSLRVIAGIEAADLTSLLEQFEETQGDHSLVHLYFLGRFFKCKTMVVPCWAAIVISGVTRLAAGHVDDQMHPARLCATVFKLYPCLRKKYLKNTGNIEFHIGGFYFIFFKKNLNRNIAFY